MNDLPPLAYDRAPVTLRSRLAGLGLVICYLALFYALVMGVAFGVGVTRDVVGRWSGSIFQGVAGVAGVLALTWLMRVKLGRRSWSGMALPAPWVGHWLAGAALGIVCLMLLGGIEYALGWLHYARIDTAPHRGLSKTLLLLLAIIPSIAVGIIEELAFRGYIYQTLAERMNSWVAALVMGVAFGLLHFPNGGFGIGFMVSALILSLTFLVLRFATGSLWFPIGFHGAWDYAQTYLVGISTTGQPGYDPALVQVVQTGPEAWVGGNPSIEGGLLCMALFVVLFALAAVYAVRTGRLPAVRRG